MTRIRSAAAIATLAAVGALGLPSQALAGKSHHLKLYKVEQHVDVEGDTDYTVSCKSGDIATDGMWRIDDVSQDNEFDILGQWTLTVPIKATGVAGNTEDYVFAFLPIAGGDVQVKLVVTCIENPVTGNGHSHSLNTTWLTAANPAVTTPGDQTYSLAAPAATCPTARSVAIAPGFDMSTQPGYGYVAKSWENNGADIGWQWRFDVQSASATEPFAVTTSLRCLERKSNLNAPGGHRHRIVHSFKSASGVTPARTFRTHQVHCGEHYKGMVGMWDNQGFNDHYFLGMDPRIKSRAFKWVNTRFDPPGPASYTALHKLSCFKDRTS